MHFTTVSDSPVSPHVSKVSEVSEGSSVNLSCTAAAPCPSQPPTITWSLPTGNVHTQIRDEEDGTKSLLSCLTFTTSRSHHDKEISCMASYLRQNQSTVAANSTVQILRVLCKNDFFSFTDDCLIDIIVRCVKLSDNKGKLSFIQVFLSYI